MCLSRVVMEEELGEQAGKGQDIMAKGAETLENKEDSYPCNALVWLEKGRCVSLTKMRPKEQVGTHS